ncbi:hypothetical protein O3M35_009514 [Rhynocoris fuscipes]|uniref:Pyrroline-5-carboxylate reductase n=1 Tax=Rhynocoris fuscipes TaxID=488301 RepID=A0AAW1D8J5_9HEMI
MTISFTNIGFIGAGNMAQAIGLRLVSEGVINPSNMIVSARSDRNLTVWSQKGVKTTTKNSDVVKKADVIFIAVKPQFFEEAMQSLAGEWKFDFRIFISVMAGKTIDYIKKTIKTIAYDSISDFDVIRVMPNTPCLVGKGCSVLCHGPTINEKYVLEIQRLMSYTGTCDIIPESLFDAVSAVSGSGPAYIYLVIESLADGAVRCGVPRDLAMKLASQTVSGAAEMVTKTGKHPGQLKDEVCSPAGTTIAAVHELEKTGIRCAFMNAVKAAAERSAELAKISKQ